MRKSLIFLVLTLLVGLSAGFITDHRKNSERELRLARTEHDFQAVDARLQETITEVLELEDGLQAYCSRWEKFGIGLVIYGHGKATEWTTNAIPFPPTYEERTKPTDGLIKLKNGWFLCRTQEVNGQLLAGYALIQTQYGFENR